MAKAKKAAPKRRRGPADQSPPPTPATRKEQETFIRSTARTCRGPVDAAKHVEWQSLMDEGRVDEARALNTRSGCGADFNDQILSNPLDGKEYSAACPKCGIETSYRAPLFG